MLNDNYNYGEKVIQTLGFPRYDILSNENTKKQILIIPSWRNYYKDSKKLFLNSKYYQSLNNLLNNQKFIELAKKYGYEIVYKPHPNIEFNIKDSPEERFIDFVKIDDQIKYSTKESYKQLFDESALMITDYSSVFFDFAYLKKPIIYYQPDDDYHYETTYFNWETMAFGEIISEETRFLEKIEEYLKNNCEMEDEYKTRVDKFFKFNDKNNSKRVYEWINNS